MSDQASNDDAQLSSSAPQAPPLPAARPLNALQRVRFGPTKARVQTSTSNIYTYTSPRSVYDYWQSDRPATSLTASHKTGLKIRAVDINPSKSHAILAGVKILKTVRLYDDPVSAKEDFNVRTAVFNYDWARSSHHDSSQNSKPTDLYDSATAQRDLFDIEDVAWSNYNDRIATAARNGKIVLYDLNKPGVHFSSLHDHLRQVHRLRFSEFNGQWLLSGSQDGTVKFWDLRSQRPATTFPGRAEAVRDVRWSPTDSLAFAFCTDNGTVQHWTLKNPSQPLAKLTAHSDTCTSINWHEDGRHLASAGHDKTVKVWDVAESTRRTPIISFRTPQEVQNLSWRPACFTRDWVSGNVIRSSSQIATSYRQYPFIHIWDVRRPYVPFREVSHRTNSCTTDMLWQSRDLLWTVGPEGDFEQHDIPFAPMQIDRRPSALAQFSPTGQLLLVTDHPTKTVVPGAQRDRALPVSSHKQNHQSASRRRSRSRSSVRQRSVDRLIFGRTPEDDVFDTNFLTPNLLRRKTSISTLPKITHSLTPPDLTKGVEKLATESLRDILDKHRPFKRRQVVRAVEGPGIEPSQVFRYLARNYRFCSIDGPQTMDLLKAACENNRAVARGANRYRDGQTWAAVGQIAMEEAQHGSFVAQNHRKQAFASLSGLGYGQQEHNNNAVNRSWGGKQHPAPGNAGNSKQAQVTGTNAMFSKILQNCAEEGRTQLASHLLLLLAPHLSTTQKIGILEPSILAMDTDPSSDSDNHSREATFGFIRSVRISDSIAEAVVTKYHQDLMVVGMYAQAAYLRKCCIPRYPAVYEDTSEDVSMQFRCPKCGDPVNNGRDKHVCESCGKKADACSFCLQKESPYETAGTYGNGATGGTDAGPSHWQGGSILFQYCFLCGHMVHMSCAAVLWTDVTAAGSGGGCATPGCGCGCVPGYWRDEQQRELEKREAARQRERVLGDERVAGESKAVGRVRGALKESVGVGMAGTPGKKVRVVSPAGKGKERAE